MKHQTITLWNVTIPQAEKLIEVIKTEIQHSMSENDFDTASELLYQIKDITSKIEFQKEIAKVESEGENDG